MIELTSEKRPVIINANRIEKGNDCEEVPGEPANGKALQRAAGWCEAAGNGPGIHASSFPSKEALRLQ